MSTSHVDAVPIPCRRGAGRTVSIRVPTISVVFVGGKHHPVIIRALSKQRAINSKAPARVELHHYPTLYGQRNAGVYRYVARHHVHITRCPGGILSNAAADLDRGKGTLTTVSPANHYSHDVYDVNVAIVINVVA